MIHVKQFLYTLFPLLMFLPGIVLPAQPLLTGQVTEKTGGAPIPYANVVVIGSGQGAACDSLGIFELALPRGKYQLEFSALGYRSKKLAVLVKEGESKTLRVALQTAVLELSDEVVVYGENEFNKTDDRLNSTDDIIRQVEGVSMLRRANFALEPSIRGMSAGQVGIVVDGMKIFSACVDRMDPVTAYVEVENLEKLEVSKGAFDMTRAPSLGGAINMVTHKPDFNRPFAIQAETGFESVSQLRLFRGVVNYANHSLAARGTFSVKQSDNFYAGEKTPVENSGYGKNNYKLDITKKFGSRQQLEFSFIGDNASDIGYPALYMDARQTKSQIYRLEHQWDIPFRGVQSLNSKIYYNRIDHWMDDYQRDVTDRPVMPNMNMPMFGKTRTLGIIEELSILSGRQIFKLILDAYRLTAFADMEMISIYPGVSEAYLLNIGDALLYNAAATIDYQSIFSHRLRLRANLRMDYSDRDIQNEDARRQLEGFWNGGDTRQIYTALSASAVVDYKLNQYQNIQLALAQIGRLPTHTENYGYFLYNYTDGYFYTGNPSLNPERGWQAEMALQHSTARFNLRLNAYYNEIQNYITGLVQSEEFKIYTNISSAYITGAELKGNFDLSRVWKLTASAAYTYGQNREMKEPLPLIPPVEGSLGLQYNRGRYWFSLDSRFAGAQKRIAYLTTMESETAAFIVLNLRSRIQVWDFLEAKLGVENIFDHFYREHLSINKLPARGRNVYLGFNIRFGS